MWRWCCAEVYKLFSMLNHSVQASWDKADMHCNVNKSARCCSFLCGALTPAVVLHSVLWTLYCGKPGIPWWGGSEGAIEHPSVHPSPLPSPPPPSQQGQMFCRGSSWLAQKHCEKSCNQPTCFPFPWPYTPVRYSQGGDKRGESYCLQRVPLLIMEI